MATCQNVCAVSDTYVAEAMRNSVCEVVTNGLVKKVWQCEQPEGMSSRGCVKHDVLEVGKVWVLQELHHLADGNCFVHSRRECIKQLTCKPYAFSSHMWKENVFSGHRLGSCATLLMATASSAPGGNATSFLPASSMHMHHRCGKQCS